MRQFKTGANRDGDANKIDFEGHLSPTVLLAYGRYMHKNRTLADGTVRASDNWQKGIPMPVYMKSLVRHVWEAWIHHRSGSNNKALMIDVLCAVMFNVMGYLHELLRSTNPDIRELCTCGVWPKGDCDGACLKDQTIRKK